MFLYKRNACFTLNFVWLLSHFLVSIGAANIDNVLSMPSSQSRSNADEHTLTQLHFQPNIKR